ncbi:MAG: hypothetical protein IKI93_12450 [Clostridia bacterium]|nr:hypothetical protein [Clostridia bacterium]
MMKKKLLYLTGGICGVLLIVSLIFTITTAAQAYNEYGNLLVLRTDNDITTALESTGMPHSAEEVEPGVWEIRSRHELIPMIHVLMKDKGETDPVYEAAQGGMFTLILTLWALFTVTCLTAAFASKKYVRWIAFLLAFLGSLACPAVLMEVVCKIPESAVNGTLSTGLILTAVLTLLCLIHAVILIRKSRSVT